MGHWCFLAQHCQKPKQPASQTLKIALRKYRLFKDTTFNEQEDLQELKTGAALHHNVDLVLVYPTYNTHSARSQISSARDAFCIEEI